MRSRIYTGDVMHARREPVPHHFKYPVYVYAVDLDELPGIGQSNPWFGYNRFSIASIRDEDYLNGGPEPIKTKLLRYLNEGGCGGGIERIEMVTSARYFNYVFNPVSFYYCHGADGSLRCAAAEVNNTFGERHLYILDAPEGKDRGDLAAYRVKKTFHVSPFYDMRGDYEFHFAPLADTMQIRVNIRRDGEIVFRSRLRGNAVPLTPGNLLKTLARYPVTAWLTMPRILWEAAKLYYRKKLRVYTKPNPTSAMTIQAAPPTWRERFCMNLAMGWLSNVKKGRLGVEMPDRTQLAFGEAEGGGRASLKIRNHQFFTKGVFGGDVGFGESYVDGDWDTDDLTGLLKLFSENRDSLNNLVVRWAWPGRAANRVRHRMRKNTVSGSRENIHAHYDIGNDFYRLFLGQSMVYSCGIYENPGDGLEEAQRNKLRAMIRKARIRPGDRVLEIGAGWGGFAAEAAKTVGCRVTAATISEEQFRWMRRRVDEENLRDRIEPILCDYRDIKGEFDRIVSIEMLEAVGHEYLGEFFAACSRLLKPDGLLALQVITMPDQRYDVYRRDTDWIQKYIFPGAVVPSLKAINDAAASRSDFFIESLENIGVHYAKTLRQWRGNLEASREAVRQLGFDERFVRMWRYYFSYCEAGFATRTLGNLQLVFTRPNNPSLNESPAV